MPGRFDWRYELDSIQRGLDRDLQQQTGQIVPWYVYDSVTTTVDPIYDVASSSPFGRVWHRPVNVPVLDAMKLEDTETQNSRGLYTVDSLRIILSIDALRLAGLEDVVENPDSHLVDRLVYENKVFGIDQVRIRGRLKGDYSYTIAAVDATQVKRDELVNDDQQMWARFLPLDYT